MSTSLTTETTGTLNVLFDQLRRLAGGTLEMGAFRMWFTSVRWDTKSGFNTEALAPLGWAIETALFEWSQFPDEFLPSDLIASVENVVQREGIHYAPQSRNLVQTASGARTFVTLVTQVAALGAGRVNIAALGQQRGAPLSVQGTVASQSRSVPILVPQR
jgi:hypothetical protein